MLPVFTFTDNLLSLFYTIMTPHYHTRTTSPAVTHKRDGFWVARHCTVRMSLGRLRRAWFCQQRQHTTTYTYKLVDTSPPAAVIHSKIWPYSDLDLDHRPSKSRQYPDIHTQPKFGGIPSISWYRTHGQPENIVSYGLPIVDRLVTILCVILTTRLFTNCSIHIILTYPRHGCHRSWQI